VDDEPSVLGVLRLVSRRLGPEWDVSYAEGGSQALGMLQQGPFDVVVSDMRMPDASGVEVLKEVMKVSPRSARVILSGFADQEMVLQSVGVTHQFLAKPCDVQLLRSTIQRLLSLNEALASERFRSILAGIQSLPSLPSTYTRLMDELSAPDATVESVGDLIAEDVSLTAKLLQLANSAYFGLSRRASTVAEAVQILGFSMVKTLALSIFMYTRFDPARLPGFPLERIWKHSVATGLTARKLAMQERKGPEIVDVGFTAGILHDIGKLVMGLALPEEYQACVARAVQETMPQWQAERESLGVTHAEVGAYLLGLWGLPADLVEAVAWHHQPRLREPEEFSAVTVVHLADYLQSKQTPANDPPLPSVLDHEHLKAVGFSGELDPG